jgi:hypothetical protein
MGEIIHTDFSLQNILKNGTWKSGDMAGYSNLSESGCVDVRSTELMFGGGTSLLAVFNLRVLLPNSRLVTKLFS